MDHPNSSEPQSKQPLIAEIENRLQFNVFVSIFFCTLAYSVAKALNKPDIDANKALMTWAAVPGAYLLGYFFFELGRSEIKTGMLKLVDIALLLGAFLYVLPIFEIAAAEAKWHRIEVWLGIVSLWAIPILAFVLAVVILVAAVIGACAKSPEPQQ